MIKCMKEFLRFSLCMCLVALCSSGALANSGVAVFDDALWRVFSVRQNFDASYFKTIGSADGAFLKPGLYRGDDTQHWRIRLLGSGYELEHEASGLCLADINGVASLKDCGTVGATWQIVLLRQGSDSRAALYNLRSEFGNCVHVTQPFLFPSKVELGNNCSASTAKMYVEPAGWGERPQSVNPIYAINGLLIIKRYTNVDGVTEGELSDSTILNVKKSYEQHLPLWLSRITDGKVRYMPSVIVSDEPLTSMSDPDEGGASLPSADFVQDEINRHVLRGQYDAVQIAFTGGDGAYGGWGWTPGANIYSKHAIWSTINVGGDEIFDGVKEVTNPNEGAFINYLGDAFSRSEPTEVFIHEPMHGYDSYMKELFGDFFLPSPPLWGDGRSGTYLHGDIRSGYDANPAEGTNYLHWYRDYWLGRVVGKDGYYKGFGQKLFNAPAIRERAMSPELMEFNLVHASGKCISSQDGLDNPLIESDLEFNSTCNSLGQSFKIRDSGSIEHIASGFCVHPKGGDALIGKKLVLWPSCDDPSLGFEFTNGGSIRHIASGLCVHPLEGVIAPSDGSALVLWNTCDEPKLKFSKLIRN